MSRSVKNTRPRGRPTERPKSHDETEERDLNFILRWFFRLSAGIGFVLTVVIGLCWIVLFLWILKLLYGLLT